MEPGRDPAPPSGVDDARDRDRPSLRPAARTVVTCRTPHPGRLTPPVARRNVQAERAAHAVGRAKRHDALQGRDVVEPTTRPRTAQASSIRRCRPCASVRLPLRRRPRRAAVGRPPWAGWRRARGGCWFSGPRQYREPRVDAKASGPPGCRARRGESRIDARISASLRSRSSGREAASRGRLRETGDDMIDALRSRAECVARHTFLYSFVTRLLDDGSDIRTVRELLGDADVSTTMIYTHVLRRRPSGVRSPVDRLPGGDSGGPRQADPSKSARRGGATPRQSPGRPVGSRRRSVRRGVRRASTLPDSGSCGPVE
ncbi:MAG: tyrosine-type recombinase/integrase [Planctomycetes bacterium]|nr:tyrosine-type recombinase/integrase [Planctomycetota bacterium]